MAKDLKTQLGVAILTLESIERPLNEVYSALKEVHDALFGESPVTLDEPQVTMFESLTKNMREEAKATRPKNGTAKYVQLKECHKAARQPQGIKVYLYLKKNKGVWFTVKQIGRNMKIGTPSLHTLLPRLERLKVVERANGRPQKWRVAKNSELMERNAAARDDLNLR